VEKRPDQAIIGQLNELLQDAQAGKLVGFLAAAHYGGAAHGYYGGGSLCNNPTFGLAAICHLATKLLTA
jgi:hypothetical protein